MQAKTDQNTYKITPNSYFIWNIPSLKKGADISTRQLLWRIMTRKHKRKVSIIYLHLQLELFVLEGKPKDESATVADSEIKPSTYIHTFKQINYILLRYSLFFFDIGVLILRNENGRSSGEMHMWTGNELEMSTTLHIHPIMILSILIIESTVQRVGQLVVTSSSIYACVQMNMEKCYKITK